MRSWLEEGPVGEKAGCARREEELPWRRSPLIDHLPATKPVSQMRLLPSPALPAQRQVRVPCQAPEIERERERERERGASH